MPMPRILGGGVLILVEVPLYPGVQRTPVADEWRSRKPSSFFAKHCYGGRSRQKSRFVIHQWRAGSHVSQWGHMTCLKSPWGEIWIPRILEDSLDLIYRSPCNSLLQSERTQGFATDPVY